MCKHHIMDNDQIIPIKSWMDLETPGDWDTINQVKNIARLPWAFKHVALMPDGLVGKGATVGTVIAMKNAVSPAAVGVDIGCGMGAIKTNLKTSDLPDSLSALRSRIEELIPVGFNQHSNPAINSNSIKLFNEFKNLDSRVQSLESTAINQCGTLGGGNHFIELCIDTEDNVWMMLHSGSRRIGKELAEIHINIAKELAHNQDLPDRDLAVFLSGTPEMEAYRRDLFWAQRYAYLNRQTMFELYKQGMKEFFPQVEFGEPILCHHNYVSEENHFGEDVIITRKGAISARSGELGIVPGSMGAASFIVEGLGNPDSFMSASHGAGRKMSRGAAKRTFTLEDLEAQTQGVECRKDQGVLDEIPGTYKDIWKVMKNQEDLVKVVAQLKQVMCIKG